jgi:two-component system chemotaxis response regulator CheY
MASKPWVGNSVIVVDDSPMVRNELIRLYEQVGMKVKGVAENGVVALDMVRKDRPDLVSVDLIMPEMDGVECYKKLRVYDPTLKIVMLSWLGGDAKIQDNLKEIVPTHLMHPKRTTAEELESRLAKVYGIVPINVPQKIEPEDDFTTGDLKALSVRVS